MIVTCESCKSRYKLDDAKITGRGAKITCPKCKAVFVVYAKDQNEVSRPTLPSGTPPVGTPPTSGGLADAVKAADRKAAAPGVAVAGPGTTPTPPLGTPASSEEWEDEPTRVGDSEGGHEVVRGRPQAPAGSQVGSSSAASVGSAAPTPSASAPAPSASAPAPSAGASSADVAARAASLDFRKVGVTTWKVKVKIGLIYDFSDIKTLRKYIQDGRVTATDVVSWDGKSWRAIGDIPDLDAFFVETWDMLAARKEDPSSATLAPAPPNAEVAKAIEEARTPQKSGGEPNQFADPFEENRKKQRDRAELKKTAPVPPPQPEPPPPARRSPTLVLGLVLLLAVAAGAYWWMQQQSASSGQAQQPAAGPRPSGGTQDIREQINQDLEQALRNNPSGEANGPAPTEGATAVAPPPDRTPVVRSGVPEGARPVVPKNPGTATATPGVQEAETSAADHEAVGDDASRGGDWATAAQAYQKAVSLDGKSARLMSKLGRAQLESGDAAAQATLQRAAQMGAKDAQKYLGDLAARNGDAAGAVGHYQTYLQGSPADAAEIQKKITQLSGG